MVGKEETRASAPRWFTEKDLRARFQVSRMTIHRWRKAGYLPAPVRPTGVGRGRIVRWLPHEIEKFETRLAEDRGRAVNVEEVRA